MSTFKRMASGITTSAAVIPATFAVMALIVVGAFAMYSDYLSTKLGIEAFGLRTAVPNEIKYLALIPQAVQIVIVYVLGTRDMSVKMLRMNFVMYFIALGFDTATDVYFKAYGMPASQWVIALIVTIVFYTIGSEILFTTGISIFVEIFPMFLEKLSVFFQEIMSVLARAVSWAFGEADDDDDSLESRKSSATGGLRR